jgi:hypothetical protein
LYIRKFIDLLSMKFSITKLLLKYYFRLEDEQLVMLGTVIQKGSLTAVLYTEQLWKQVSFSERLLSVLKLNWNPSAKLLEHEAKKVFLESTFGTENDYGHKLYNLMVWHGSRKWNQDFLTEHDIKRVDALNGLYILLQNRHRKATSSYLQLNMADRHPDMCVLVHPLVAKLPVKSLQYCLLLDASFAFNAIREAQHPQADDLIAYLYDILNVQVRTAMSFHKMILSINESLVKEEHTVLLGSEYEAVNEAGHIITDLKATIEKTVAFIGVIYGKTNLDSLQKHKQRIAALAQLIPEKTKELWYNDFIFDAISSSSIESLNSLRTGLVHKKGVGNLQPHSYLSRNVKDSPILSIFDQLLELHARNTAVLLGALALLTDELMERMPVDYPFTAIPVD